MRSWWRRRRHNLTWKRVTKDITRVLALLIFLVNNDHHSDETLEEWKNEVIGILSRLESDLDHL